MATRHFLTLLDLTPDELAYLIQRAIKIKTDLKANGPVYTPLPNRTLAMIFEKSSTRTRVSFETGMAQFGGHALFLSPRDTQLGRGEPIEDTARVLSEMVDAVMIRTFSHQGLETYASASSVPVINALSDDYHPCQLLADVIPGQSCAAASKVAPRCGLAMAIICATPGSTPPASSAFICGSAARKAMNHAKISWPLRVTASPCSTTHKKRLKVLT